MATAPSPIIVPGNQKVDENEEVIIAEALFDRYSLKNKIQYIYLWIAKVTVAIPCGAICVPGIVCIGCAYGCHGASAWRLYLTSTGLHYTSVCPTGCVRGKKFIPLSDIRDASLKETVSDGRIRVNTLIINKTDSKTVKFSCIFNVTDFCAAINSILKQD